MTLVALSSGYDRLSDRSPCRNVARGVEISKRRIPTRDTGEQALRLSVGSFRMSTPRALLTGMLRVNLKQTNTKHGRLVCQELLELVEAPVGMLRPLSFSNRSGSDAFEILNGNRGPKCLSLLDDVFADNMVGVALKSFLFARQLFQVSFRRLRTLLLQCLPKPVIALACAFYLFAGECLAFGVGGDVHDAQINPKNLVGFEWRGIINLAGGKQVEVASVEDKVGFAAPMLQQMRLTLPADERNALPSACSPNADCRVIEIEREDATVVSNPPVFLETSLLFLIQLIGIGNLRNCAYGYLSRQAEGLACDVVGFVMEGELVEFLPFPSYLGNSVTSSIHNLKGIA